MGCYYLKYLFDRFKNVNVVLCAYNAGEGNVRKWLKNKEYSLDGKTIKSIPFNETDKYVKKINKTYKKYIESRKHLEKVLYG